MDYNEFAEKIKVKYPEYKDMDNKDLAQRIVAKYPEYESQVTFDVANKGIDITPSGLVKQATAGVVAPLRALTRGETIPQAYKRAREIQDESVLNKLSPAVDVGASLWLPQAKIAQGAGLLPKLVNYGATGAYQGGLIGGIDALKENADLGNVAKGIAKGAGIGLGIGAGLPLVGKVAEQGLKLLPMAGGFASRVLGRVQPETLQQAVKPNSKALDLSREQAQNLLMDTTERVQNTYDDILSQRGKEVGDAIDNLRGEDFKPIKTQDLQEDIISTFDQYQGDKINPARNMTGDLEQNLLNLVKQGNVKPEELVDLTKKTNVVGEFLPKKKEEAYSIVSQAINRDKNWVKSQLASKSSNKGLQKRQETISEMLENTDDRLYDLERSEYDYYKHSGIGDTADTDIARRAYDDIVNDRFYLEASPQDKMYNELQNKYTDILKNYAKNPDEEMAFMQLENLTKNLPEKVKQDYMEKFFNDTYALNNANSVRPIDLQRIKEQVGKMANWGDETSRQYAEPITRQIYGKFQQRLSDLSPALAEANKRFSNVVNFQKNEGLKRILKPGDNIDTASSALRNYNSTVTKGNTNRNIQDLENLFVKEGKQPFLNDIDDVNAAMDLLNARGTGDSWLANVATQMTRPALKLARAYNRSSLPALYRELGLRIPRGLTPVLYGSVEFND